MSGNRRRRWFLPADQDLCGLLNDQMTVTLEGLDALVAWTAGDAAASDQVRDCEHRADDRKRELWRALREVFSPPLDAEDLYALSADLDGVLNGAKDLVRETDVIGVSPDAVMHDIAELLAEAVRHLARAFTQLGTSGAGATEAADAAIMAQRRVEHVYRRGMSELLSLEDLHVVIARRELYRRLSRIGDVVHQVVERVWYAVVKES